ncbi:MAG: ABC transporter permease [Pseudomonadota bacterium]
MFHYIVERILLMFPTLLVISALIFIIIQLPPGDYLSTTIAELESQGETSTEQIEYYKNLYGLDQPQIIQYFKWVGGMLQGDFGYSFEYQKPVSEVIGDRMWLTVLVSVSTILFIYIVSFPIAIYSAVNQYSTGDYALTFIGFLGLATPNFLLALILIYIAKSWFGTEIGGLMDQRFIDQDWSVEKALSVLEHLWLPVIVIGTSGTASMIRRLRANLLDELHKQYYITAKAKGLSPFKALLKYPLRSSLNPFIADIGSILPEVISGSAIVSVVLSLDTTGPILLEALTSQDTYLAGSFLMFLSLLTIIGMLVSDLALGLLDPRIRFGSGVQK